MKKYFTIIVTAWCYKFCASTTKLLLNSKCNETFAMLTQDQKFIDTHLDPNPFTLENKMGKDISFKTKDAIDGHAYEIKAIAASNNYIFVIHEWWGLNDYIKLEAEKIYKNLGNVNVIAIDLYDRKVASVKDSAAKYMQSVNTERAENIITGLLNYVGKNANIATIGWCFGGGWSMQATLLAGKQSKACVMYYGSPEENLEKLKTLNAPVFFVWPEQDQWINKTMVSKFEANMKIANKSVEVKGLQCRSCFCKPKQSKV
jgi:carboxymethylenebutenolidase